MNEDLKIFLKYIFNPRGLLEEMAGGIKKLLEPKIFSSILIAVGIVFLIRLSPPTNAYAFILLLSFSLIIIMRNVYKGGEHRHWYRQNLKRKCDDGRTD